MKLKIERIEELRLKGNKEFLVTDLLKTCFNADFKHRSFFQNRHHCRFLLWDEDVLIGHLAVAFRAIRLGNTLTDIIGIGEVAVAPQFRQRGFGMSLLEAAIEEGRLAGADFAVLFGERSIYSAAGFVVAANTVKTCQMEGAHTAKIVEEVSDYLMVKPLGDAVWDKEAVVDLAGFPF